MAWTKLLTPAWLGISGAANQLNTTEREIKQRIANGEFVTKQATPNVTEIKFHMTDGTPKYIVAVPGAPSPTPPAAPPPNAPASGPKDTNRAPKPTYRQRRGKREIP